jgi:4-amino-4-deoxy-L-arabinose transferase-like glycosyltransferase
MAWSDRPDLFRSSRLGLILIALAGAPYLLGLDRLPVVIGGDEVQFAVHAESIVRSGRDLNGTAYPLFVKITDPLVPNHSSAIWYQPLLFYAMTPFIWLFGVHEWTARLPVALMAVANIWLIYAIGCRLFRDRRLGIAAALSLALTPAHVIVSRQALDYVAPLPFVLGWFLCLLRYLDTGSTRSLAGGASLLGAGLISYIAAWMLMPMYFAMTWIAVWRSPSPNRTRALAIATVAFAIPLLIVAVALAANPEMFSNTLARYSVSGAPQARPGMFERITLYWNYFNPSFLFFAGGSNPTQATGRAGVFLLALWPLMLIGLREMWVRRSDRSWIVLAAFVLAPLPIAVTMPAAAAYSIARAMALLPFGVLIAVWGLRALMQQGPWPRRIAVALVALIPLQFALFAADYRGDYQLRAAPRLDPANTRAVADAVLAHDTTSPIPAVYLSHHLDDGGVRWRFFMLKEHRADLWDRSRAINLAEPLPAVEPGALIVCYASDTASDMLIARGYTVLAEIAGVAGERSSIVLKAPG